MKKVNILTMFVTAMIAMIVVLCTGCTAPRNSSVLEYEANGEYNLTGYNGKVYTFDAPNDYYEVVMMNDTENFIFIIHNTGSRGVSFQSMVYKNGIFYGLTKNYVLFKESDGSLKAVSIKEKRNCQLGEYRFYVEDFNSLSREEQSSAIIPNGYYHCQF